MIIPGWRSKLLKKEQLHYHRCPKCNEKGGLSVKINSVYFHVFYIPLFPFRKKEIVECDFCLSKLKSKEMSEGLKIEMHNVKAKVSFPLKQFVGLFVLLVCTFFIGRIWVNMDKKDKAYIVNPKEGDVYLTKLGRGVFTTYKVKAVTADSVFVWPNKQTVDKIMKLSKIDHLDSYSIKTIAFSRKALTEKLASGEVLSVTRKQKEME